MAGLRTPVEPKKNRIWFPSLAIKCPKERIMTELYSFMYIYVCGNHVWINEVCIYGCPGNAAHVSDQPLPNPPWIDDGTCPSHHLTRGATWSISSSLCRSHVHRAVDHGSRLHYLIHNPPFTGHRRVRVRLNGDVYGGSDCIEVILKVAYSLFNSETTLLSYIRNSRGIHFETRNSTSA